MIKHPTDRQLRSLRVGTLVKTDYYKGEGDIVRRVVFKEKNQAYSSGYVVSADGGPKCEKCGRPAGHEIPRVDGYWFMPVEDGK